MRCIEVLQLAHTVLSFVCVGYIVVCFILFWHKTYKSPPSELTTTPITFSRMNPAIVKTGQLLFSIAPGSTNHYRRRTIDYDIDQLKQEGITTVVSCLTQNDIRRLHMENYEEALLENNIQLIKCPIVDFGVPSDVRTYDRTASTVAEILSHDGTVLIHCNSGRGRTGLFAAAVLSKLWPFKGGREIIKDIKQDLKGAFDTILQRLYFRCYINDFY